VKISDIFISAGEKGDFALIEKDYIDKFKIELEKYFNIEDDYNYADYIYSSEKLAALNGKKLHNKKNLVNQFIKKNPNFTVKNLEPENFKDCFQLAEKWCKNKNCEDLGFSHEKSALSIAFANFQALNLEGIIIFVNNQPAAFSIFSRMNAEMYDIHFEKFDSDIKGASQFINFQTAQFLSKKCLWINREQDMGIDSLRYAKQSYYPEHFILTCRLNRI